MNSGNPSTNCGIVGAGVHSVPALEKAIRILNLLASDGDIGGSTAMAQRLGISQSTCYRTLQTLEAADWIRTAEDGRYAFSLGLLPFVRPLQGLDRMVDRVRPMLDSLVESTGLSVKLSMRQGTDQVTLARVETSRPMGVSSPVGARFPVVAGASGACLLSPLPEAEIERIIAHADRAGLWDHDNADTLRHRIAACRRDGVCDNLGTHPQGIDTLSAAVSTPRQQFAITLIGLRGDLDGERSGYARELLKHTAKTAGAALESHQ